MRDQSRRSAQRKLGENSEDARRQLIEAAERCVKRHGVNKTTMEDIAREAGVSRPSVYRYFLDRDDLFVSVLSERTRALTGKALRFMAKQPSDVEALVEGLIYLAGYGLREPFIRRMIFAEPSDISDRLLGTIPNEVGLEFTGRFWDPWLEQAQSRGAVAADLEPATVRQWLLSVTVVLMARLETHPELVDDYRQMLYRFVVPAFLPR